MARFKILKIVFSLLLVGILVVSIDFRKDVWTGICFTAFSILEILVLLGFSILSRALRWHFLMIEKSKNYSLRFFHSVKYLLIGSALNTLMPAGSGDIAKSYFGYRDTGIKEDMLAVSLFDKFIAIGSISILGLYSLYITENVIFLLAIVASLFPITLAYLAPKLEGTSLMKPLIDRFSNGNLDIRILLEGFQFGSRNILVGFTLSILGWILTYLLLFKCLQLINQSIHLTEVFINSPLLTLGRLFPFTLNGLGSDEALMVYLFSDTALSPDEIVIGAILYRIILTVLPAVLGVLFIIKSK